MVSVCLPSDALSQQLPFYLSFSYLGFRVSLHSCSSKAQPLLLTLDEGYLLTAAPPELDRGVAPLSPPAPTQLPLLGLGVGLNLNIQKTKINEELDADHVVHDGRVMQGFADGHVAVIGHGRQEEKLSHTQDNNKK